jgi:hypothetical protein
MCSNLLSYQLMWREYGSYHQNFNWNLCRLNYGGEKEMKEEWHVTFF